MWRWLTDRIGRTLLGDLWLTETTHGHLAAAALEAVMDERASSTDTEEER